MENVIQHNVFSLFLTRSGWKKIQSTNEGVDIYIEPNEIDPLEIYMPNKNITRYNEIINDAIRTLSFSLNRKENELKNQIIGFDKDNHNYRIKTNDPESVPITIVHEILSATRCMIKEASYLELAKEYHALCPKDRKIRKSPSEESKKYLSSCKFTHTWRGSFGVTVQAPLLMPSIGLSENIPDTLGRKSTKLILNGIKLINAAVKTKSHNYILDNIKQDREFLIFNNFPELQENLKSNSIEYSIETSPLIMIDKNKYNESKININNTSLRYIERAIDELKKNDNELTIELVGFPEKIKSEKKYLLNGLDGDRRVTVKGVSRDIDYASLTMSLSLEDYKKAIKAQEIPRDVKVKCKVKKKNKGWDVVEVYSFELL